MKSHQTKVVTDGLRLAARMNHRIAAGISRVVDRHMSWAEPVWHDALDRGGWLTVEMIERQHGPALAAGKKTNPTSDVLHRLAELGYLQAREREASLPKSVSGFEFRAMVPTCAPKPRQVSDDQFSGIEFVSSIFWLGDHRAEC